MNDFKFLFNSRNNAFQISTCCALAIFDLSGSHYHNCHFAYEYGNSFLIAFFFLDYILVLIFDMKLSRNGTRESAFMAKKQMKRK
jgi:hypothetical protein